jgi:DNA-binding MarR family transcriptional regulator
MSIEKEIKSKFRNGGHKAAVNIILTSNWVLEKQKTHLDRGGLTPQQYNILRILRGSTTPLSTLQIRERMLDKMSDTSRIVDRLIAKNLVEKYINRHDKRLVDVTITQNGRDLLEMMDNYSSEIDNIFQNLTELEINQLNFLLDKTRKQNNDE